MICKPYLLITILCCSLGYTSSVRPNPAEDGKAVVADATETIYRAIQEQCEEIEKSPLRLHQLVEEILIPHADFQRMAQLALGKHWRTADDNQKIEFVIQFRHILTRTYATAVQMASLEAIHYLPSRAGAKPNTMTVRTEVRRPGEPMVAINYPLYQKDGNWLVYDIIVDGMSLVSNYRSTFSEQIQKGGFPALIAMLEKKNQQPIVESNADLIRRRADRACK